MCIFSKSVKDVQTNASSFGEQYAREKYNVLAADDIYSLRPSKEWILHYRNGI